MKIISSLVLLSSITACSVAPNMSQLNTEYKQKRIAVVVANGSYQSEESLGNAPAKSAEKMSNILTKQGFDVYQFHDVTLTGLKKAVDTLKTALVKAKEEAKKKGESDNTLGLFFYSGHGYQDTSVGDDDSYLMPIDFPDMGKMEQNDLSYRGMFQEHSLSLSSIIDKLSVSKKIDGQTDAKGADGKNGIIIALDACRGTEKVASTSGSQSQGIAYGPKKTLHSGFMIPQKVGIPPNFIVSFATKPGYIGVGEKEEPSSYVKSLTKYLANTDLSVYDVFDRVNKDTRKRAEDMKDSSEKTGQVATFIHGEDPEGFFKETYLSGQLGTISPSAHP